MTYITSGYFLAFHEGHKKYLSDVSKLGDMVVIINNEAQQELKYGKLIKDPLLIKREIEEEFPNSVVLISRDEDRSVSNSIRVANAIINDKCTFVKDGGEYNIETLPEAKVCKKLGIDVLFLKNPKIASSSELLGLEKR